MNRKGKLALKKEFRAWTGGFSPESDYQITVYMDYAVLRCFNSEHTRRVLQEWMVDDDPDKDIANELPDLWQRRF
jgi:hypothetical protein